MDLSSPPPAGRPPRPIGLLDRFLALQHRRGWRGERRMRRLLQRNHLHHLIRVRTRHGLVLSLDPDQLLEDVVIRAGYYEEQVLGAILEEVGRDGVFWDVGANVGLHSLTVKLLRPDVQVVAFEPSPPTAARLAAHILDAGVDVRFLSVALADHGGYAPLSIKVAHNSGQSSLRPRPEVDYDHTFLCRCERADTLVAEHGLPVPTMMKVDVEGFEYEVLSGLGPLLEDSTLRAVIVEAAPDFLEQGTRSPLGGLLHGAGFVVTPLPGPEGEATINFLARRERGISRRGGPGRSPGI